MKCIFAIDGTEFLVDDDDFDILSQFRWRKNIYGYACRDQRCGDGVWRSVSMHRQIMGLERGDGLQVDHIDHNPRNNVRENLRVCTKAQNAKNHAVMSTNKTGFKGVYWRKQIQRFCATIYYDGKQRHIGSFTDPHEAAHAYNKEAIKHHGEFACLNPVGK